MRLDGRDVRLPSRSRSAISVVIPRRISVGLQWRSRLSSLPDRVRQALAPDYAVEREIAAGMGVAFRAHDSRLRARGLADSLAGAC